MKAELAMKMVAPVMLVLAASVSLISPAWAAPPGAAVSSALALLGVGLLLVLGALVMRRRQR